MPIKIPALRFAPRLLLAVALLAAGGTSRAVATGVCGNGVVEAGEECDPGGGLFCNGDPSEGPCATGAQCPGGVNCYFAFGCCKFNCQFVGQGADCFDGNTCTVNDHCDNVGRCIGSFVADGTPCEDDVFCNGVDTCAAGECLAHAGDPCAGATDCLTTCDEDAEACLSTPFVPCGDDGNACSDDVCDGFGACTHPPLPGGTVCRPMATACDVPETCAGGGVPCPADIVVPNGTPCGDACTTNGTCQSGSCTAGTPLVCDDGNVCNGLETCDSLLGCQPGVPLDCTDGESCTDDPCDPLGGCSQHPLRPEGSSCDDGDACTTLDTCANAVCQGGPTFLAERQVKLVNLATINDDCAAFDPGGLVKLGKDTAMPDFTTLTGDRVKIGQASSIYDVEANFLAAKGVDIRGSQSAATLPLAAAFCTIPPIACGGEDITIANLEIRTLTPGAYGNLTIGEGAIVNMKPGEYVFCQLRTGRGARITFLGNSPSLVRVERRVGIVNENGYGPAAGVPWPTLHAARALVKFGADSVIRTHVLAPEAKVKVLRGTLLDGAVCARELKGAWHVTLSCTETLPD